MTSWGFSILPFTNDLRNAFAQLHLSLLPLFCVTETSQHSIVIYVNNGHKIAFSPSAVDCLQNIKECSDAPKQITLTNSFK